MNREQMHCMLGIFNPDEKVWFYLIHPGCRHVVLLVLDECGHELARKEFGANPSDWDMHSPAKNTVHPLETAGELQASEVKDVKDFFQKLRDLELMASAIASY
ncbi:hypothetical protein [Kosakonia pseudosacchari]|uniref:hypothetical protein n=1 Tax=Kosakonia pseudosacchari TaxID=1646340 RepID=UPI00187F581B|nr:hypothetical protein [Kosakonia pseudosacchari]QOV66514.1 hypothetical protein IP581_23525 [Kosakonia pseudosacchari]